MKIKISENCNTITKQQIANQWTVAVFSNDTETLNSLMTDEISWEIVGSKNLENKEEYFQFIEENFKGICELIIDQTISHGKIVAVQGFANTEKYKIHFAHFINFKSAGAKVIQSIKSFIVEGPL